MGALEPADVAAFIRRQPKGRCLALTGGHSSTGKDRRISLACRLPKAAARTKTMLEAVDEQASAATAGLEAESAEKRVIGSSCIGQIARWAA
jgi:hypothetical protein